MTVLQSFGAEWLVRLMAIDGDRHRLDLSGLLHGPTDPAAVAPGPDQSEALVHDTGR